MGWSVRVPPGQSERRARHGYIGDVKLSAHLRLVPRVVRQALGFQSALCDLTPVLAAHDRMAERKRHRPQAHAEQRRHNQIIRGLL